MAYVYLHKKNYLQTPMFLGTNLPKMFNSIPIPIYIYIQKCLWKDKKYWLKCLQKRSFVDANYIVEICVYTFIYYAVVRVPFIF